MRLITLALALFLSPVSFATPILYSFEGYTNNIILTSYVTSGGVINHDSTSPLIREDGTIVTNGDTFMTGQMVFDPAATRDGAGGSGLGEVFFWTFSTQGLTYYGAGGSFHYLTFNPESFVYSDEVAYGGYGPDVTSLKFNFNGEPFAYGPANFPVNDFTDGYFSTAIDVAWVNNDISMGGLEGVITDLRITTAHPVPGPSSFVIMASGLLMVWARRARSGGNKGASTVLEAVE